MMLSALSATIILAACVSCAAVELDGEESNLTRAEQINDIQKKVSDLWHKLVYVKPVTSGNDERTIYATCQVKPSSTLEANKSQVTGQVLFKQLYPDGKMNIFFDLAGFPVDTRNASARAIHIHKFGDLSNGCDGTSSHYNPHSVDHPHHPGDFGNFPVKDGKIRKFRSNFSASLFGPYSVLGRAIVVHEQEDDLGKGNNKGSLEHGNAGKRLACCVIGICGPELWNKVLDNVEQRKRRRESEGKTA
ncbi:extracellular superoxide dismutase [Cu-Zn] [Trichosurus vulpecula]|uniref:extracellular superoxide dismutase [Cu-Zn] n=1 Tax=Trichosurus vulpecula TaxID=9337 RepID=UPI00186AD25D|nr:extracellular superoxide dismutase [Cu-Zn] [Trichosurus vulpecula]